MKQKVFSLLLTLTLAATWLSVNAALSQETGQILIHTAADFSSFTVYLKSDKE